MGQRWHSAHQSNEWNCDHRENDVISTSNETQKLTVCIKCLPGVEIFWGNLAQYTGQPASGRRNFPIEKAQHQSEQQKTNYPQWSCHLRLNLIHCRLICWNENCGWCPISLRSLFFSTDTFQIQLMSSIMLGMTNTFCFFFPKLHHYKYSLSSDHQYRVPIPIVFWYIPFQLTQWQVNCEQRPFFLSGAHDLLVSSTTTV